MYAVSAFFWSSAMLGLGASGTGAGAGDCAAGVVAGGGGGGGGGGGAISASGPQPARIPTEAETRAATAKPDVRTRMRFPPSSAHGIALLGWNVNCESARRPRAESRRHRDASMH